MELLHDHQQVVEQVIKNELAEGCLAIERMTTGSCNEVYRVQLPSRTVIVRLNEDVSKMIGSEKHIPLFRERGIVVPEVIASDYSKTVVPFGYQIQTLLPGQDLRDVVSKLSESQLAAIAKEVAHIWQSLQDIPTNGKFGWVGPDSPQLYDSWTDLMRSMVNDVQERNAKTGVVGDKYLEVADDLLKRYQTYFDGVPSTFYYDDMSSKNVMIADGKFVGLVDLDTIEYGDPLDCIGRIEASWYGTPYGKTYTEAVITELQLSASQRGMVIVYALLNRIFWLSEKGIQFNQNTSSEIDQKTVSEDKKVIDDLIAALG